MISPDLFGYLIPSVVLVPLLAAALCLVVSRQPRVQNIITIVTLTGVFLCGREAAAHMARLGGGAIVNIASLSREGNFGQSNYSASKAGVAALTVVWAMELGRYGIRVNAIAPGFIETEMGATMRDDLKEKIMAGIPSGRLGRPEEIAHAAAFLLENDFVNGRVIEVETDDDTIGGHFLHLLHGEKPSEHHEESLNVSLILYAEHSFNASTFTARVVTSTLSDLYSAVTAATPARPAVASGSTPASSSRPLR